jgi:hypothetical protein
MNDDTARLRWLETVAAQMREEASEIGGRMFELNRLKEKYQMLNRAGDTYRTEDI